MNCCHFYDRLLIAASPPYPLLHHPLLVVTGASHPTEAEFKALSEALGIADVRSSMPNLSD